MRFGAIVVGDEILLGKRRDRHIPFVIESLMARGFELAWAQVVGDDPVYLQRTLERSFADAEAEQLTVFCFGGIGATPDDRTRQCAAAAAGVELVRHPGGVQILEEQFGEATYPHRIHMVEFPGGADLIPNPVNRVPGFSFRRHHFVPGFPNMSHPMIQWVLDEYFAEPAATTEVERRHIIENTPESELIPLMESLLASYQGLRISCLPSARPGVREIDLGLRGRDEQVSSAVGELLQWLDANQVSYRAWEA